MSCWPLTSLCSTIWTGWTTSMTWTSSSTWPGNHRRLAAGRIPQAVVVQQPLAADPVTGRSHQALQHTPRLLLNASAIGWYGRQGMSLWTRRCHHPRDEFTPPALPAVEQLALQARSARPGAAMVRIGLVLGTDGGACLQDAPSPIGWGSAAPGPARR